MNRTLKPQPKYLYMVLLYLLMTPSFFGCRINEFHYRDRESHFVELGYKRSIVKINGACCPGIAIKFLSYEFKAGDVLIEQERHLGSNINPDSFPLYRGSKYEILYNPKNPLQNIILMNKPVFDDNVQFEKAGAVIESVVWGNRSFIYNGFIKVRCHYNVRGKNYFLIASVPKDIFFPNK